MATQCWGQGTTAAPACVLTGLAACGSLREAATVVTTQCRPFVFAILVSKVRNGTQNLVMQRCSIQCHNE